VLGALLVLPFWVALLLALAVRKSRTLILSFTQSQFALTAALFRLARRRQSLFITSIPSTRYSSQTTPVKSNDQPRNIGS